MEKLRDIIESALVYFEAKDPHPDLANRPVPVMQRVDDRTFTAWNERRARKVADAIRRFLKK